MAHQAGNISRDDEILYSLPALSSLSKDQLNDLCAYYGLSSGGKREDTLARLIHHGERLLHTDADATMMPHHHDQSPQHPLFPPLSGNPLLPRSTITSASPAFYTTSPPSPVEKMTIPRSTTTQPNRPSIRPTLASGISSISSRSSFRLDNFLRPRDRSTVGVPFERLIGRGRRQGDETWDVIDVGDMSTTSVGLGGPGHEGVCAGMSGEDILTSLDSLGRRIDSVLNTNQTNSSNPDHHSLRPAVTRNVSHSQTWNGRSAPRNKNDPDRAGGSLGWKSAVNGGNGYDVDEGTDEFGRKGLGGTSLRRKSMNGLRNMASHISLRRAATSSSSGLSRRASSNILGRKPSSATFATASSPISARPYRQDTARSGTIKSYASASRSLAPFRSAFASTEKRETSPAKVDEVNQIYGIEELVNPPSPAPTETVGVARRHRDSVMAGPSTIRLISHGPAAIVGPIETDETPKAMGRRGLRKGASIPNMFGAGAEQILMDSPSVPKLLPLRLSTFPMDDSLSLASRRSSVCSDQDMNAFEDPQDAPPVPSIPGEPCAKPCTQADIVEPLKSPVFPGAFPATPTRQQPFIFGSPAHSLSNAEFNASTDSLLRDLGNKLGGTLKLKNLQNIESGQAEERPNGKMSSEELRKAATAWEASVLAKSTTVKSGKSGDRYAQAHQKQFGMMQSIGQPRVPSGNTAKPLPRLPSDRKPAVPEARSYKRKIEVEGSMPAQRRDRLNGTKKARVESGVLPSFARAQGSPRVASGRGPQDQNGDVKQGIVGAVTGQIAAFAKRLSSGPERLLQESSNRKPGTLPGEFDLTIDAKSGSDSTMNQPLHRKTSGLPRLPERTGPNKLKKASSTSMLGPSRAGSHIHTKGDADRPSLPGPSHRRLVSKGSTASRLSMAPEHKKSSRPAPAMPGAIVAERKAAEARSKLPAPGGGVAGRKPLPSFREEGSVFGGQRAALPAAPERRTPSPFGALGSTSLSAPTTIPPPRVKVADPGSATNHLLGGAPTPKLKQPGHHLVQSQSARHKTSSPSRKSAVVAGGLKHKTSKAALEMSRKQHGLTEQRRRERAEKGLEAELGM